MKLQGSISWGTLRTFDLVDSFTHTLFNFYEDNQTKTEELLALTKIIPQSAKEDEDHLFWASEEADWLLEELFQELEGIAPKGYYFGANEGDGSDFGFWVL